MKIYKATADDVTQVAVIHKQELLGFLPELGGEFLEKFYSISVSIDEMFLFVEKENGQIVGFVSGISNPKGLYKKIITRDILGFSWIFLKHFVKHPTNITKFVKILLYPGFSESIPELLSIAVSKKHQMKGIGRRLFTRTVNEFQSKGLHEFKISVYEKLAANGFYQKMGCQKVQTFEFLGEKMNYFIYRIDRKKLRVVLLFYDSLYANPVFAPLFGLPYIDIVAVVVSGCVVYKKNTWESLWFFFRRHGVWYFLFKLFDQFIYMVSGYFPTASKRILSYSAKAGIPIIKLDDINSSKSHEILRCLYPDILISYFNQVLKAETLQIACLGNINIHPGYLPAYRGVASSFWAKLMGEKYGGVTLHYMLPQLDSGDVLAQQKVYFQQNESLHMHNFLCCKAGGELLVKVSKEISEGNKRGIKQTKGTYYSWPKAADVALYIQKGYKLVNWSDLKLYIENV